MSTEVNINKIIIDTLKHMIKTTYIYGGHKFEDDINTEFIHNFNINNTKFKFINSDEWSTEYKKDKLKSSKYNFNFDSLDKETVYFVSQPNGSQNWPDNLIIYNNIGLLIESKSGRGGIMWNGGFPKENCIYIYNNYKDNIISLFLGQHILDNNTILNKNNIDRDCLDFQKLMNKKYKLTDNIYFYLRKMFEDRFNYTKNPNRELWIEDTLNFIDKLNWAQSYIYT